jgi:hypothetical protein
MTMYEIPFKEPFRNKPDSIRLYTGPEIMANIPLLQRVASTYIMVYGGEPWNEAYQCSQEGPARHFGFEEQAILPKTSDGRTMCPTTSCSGELIPFYTLEQVMKQLRHDLRASVDTIPLLAVWEGDNPATQETIVKGFATATCTRNRQAINDILMESPSFGGTFPDASKHLQTFWQQMDQSNIPQDAKLVYEADVAVLPECRRSLQTPKLMGEIARYAVLHGYTRAVGITRKQTGFYRPMKKRGLITDVHTIASGPEDSNPLVMYCRTKWIATIAAFGLGDLARELSSNMETETYQ